MKSASSHPLLRMSIALPFLLVMHTPVAAELRVLKMRVDQRHLLRIANTDSLKYSERAWGVPSAASSILSTSRSSPIGIQAIEGTNSLTTTLTADGVAVSGLMKGKRTNLDSNSYHTHSGSSILVLSIEVFGQSELVTFDPPTITNSFTVNSVPTSNDFGPWFAHITGYGTITPGSAYSLPVGTYTVTFDMSISNSRFGSTGDEHAWNKTINSAFHFTNMVLMPGSNQANPVLGDKVGNDWSFVAILPFLWFDPPMAQGFTFNTTGGAQFSKIVSFPIGLGSSFRVKAGTTDLGTFPANESVDFISLLGQGVNSFEVRGIQPFADATSPTAFPIMLDFTAATASFTMSPIAAPDIKLLSLPNGDLQITFDGVLQSSPDLSPASWADITPTPTSPLVIPKAQVTNRKFYRTRDP